MSKMAKPVLFILVFIYANSLCYAQSSAVNSLGNSHGQSLSLGVSTGLLFGNGELNVYRDGRSYNKLSELLWHFSPVFYLGVDLRYDWQIPSSKLKLFADGFFKFGIPGKTGNMEDRDWLDNQNADKLTHYSVHNNRTESAILIDVNIGVSFTIFNRFLLKTYISYGFTRVSWTAGGGSFLYPQADGGHEPNIIKGAAVTYRQTWNILSPGISFYGEFNRYFNIEIFFKISPLIWVSVKDEHLLRDLEITGSMFGGLFIEPGFHFTFRLDTFVSFTLFSSFKMISFTHGNGTWDYYKEPEKSLVTNALGAGYSIFDAGFVVKFNLRNLIRQVKR